MTSRSRALSRSSSSLVSACSPATAPNASMGATRREVAVSVPTLPLISMINRMIVVQYDDFNNTPRTLVFEPTVPAGSAKAPFYSNLQQLMSKIPGASVLEKVMLKYYNEPSDVLRQLGCSHAQGYLFSRPVPAAGVFAGPAPKNSVASMTQEGWIAVPDDHFVADLGIKGGADAVRCVQRRQPRPHASAVVLYERQADENSECAGRVLIDSPAGPSEVLVLADERTHAVMQRDSVWDVAPSPELRRWFNHDPEKWPEFKRRYFDELRKHENALAPLRDALSVLCEGAYPRADRIQMIFSDPTTEPRAALDQKGAKGAFDRWKEQS